MTTEYTRPLQRVMGVLGGLGPEATIDFLSKIVALTPAEVDQDHLHFIVDCNPKVPNRNNAISGGGPSPGPALAAMAQRLQRAGAEFLVMVCNTAHAFEEDIRAATSLPFVSIVQETDDEIRREFPKVTRVGVLAAQGCLDARLYDKTLASRGCTVVTLEPSDQRACMELIYRIKAGDRDPEVRAGVRRLGERLIACGAEVVIAGCTEIPLVLADGDLSRPLIDSTEVLARRSIRYALNEEPLPPHAFSTSPEKAS
jgi:aspartate racemase